MRHSRAASLQTCVADSSTGCDTATTLLKGRLLTYGDDIELSLLSTDYMKSTGIDQALVALEASIKHGDNPVYFPTDVKDSGIYSLYETLEIGRCVYPVVEIYPLFFASTPTTHLEASNLAQNYRNSPETSPKSPPPSRLLVASHPIQSRLHVSAPSPRRAHNEENVVRGEGGRAHQEKP